MQLFKYVSVASIIVLMVPGALLGYLVVISGGALNYNVDVSLNGDYFGTVHL